MAENDKSSAIDRARDAYRNIRQYVEGIDESDMLKPNRVGVWSGKDLVIHIAIGESIGARVLDDLSAGQPVSSPSEEVDINALNEQRVKERAGMSLQEALGFWQTRHEELLDAYLRASVEREDILLNFTVHHYRAHFPDFRHVKPFKALSDEERSILLEEMDESHTNFLQFVQGIDDELLLRENQVGIWSGKDLIAHLAHWQEAAISLTSELENDRPGKWPGQDDNKIHEWNESKVEATRDMTLDEVRTYQQNAYDQLRKKIATSPFATRAAGVGATAFHYELHENDFRSLTE